MPNPSSATSARGPAHKPANQEERDIQAFIAEILADAPAEPLPAPPDFLAQAAELGIAFEPGEVEKLGRFLALLLHANTRMNLTAIKDAEQAWQRHILDALTLMAPLAELPQGATVIDIGTGGGVPGVPLAIVRPDLRFTLLDATAKKTAFVRAAMDTLGVQHASVVTARAEQAARDPQHRDTYDAAIARAVGPMATIAELATPFVKPGGVALLIKGEKATEELEHARAALHLLLAAHAATLDTPTGRIVILEKMRPTPKAYPRGNGEPKRKPLGV
ncbi:MAG: 16S rRNA (guanine(527)-N(7))-methyltransferase RsmG [Phycisphaerales bacterium]